MGEPGLCSSMCFFLGREDVGIWDFIRQASPSEKNLYVALQVFIDVKSS